MTIIYGLGNNEEKYFRTKHNIGRLLVEKLAIDIQFQESKGLMVAKKGDIAFCYSTDYMNTSGNNLNTYIKFFKPLTIDLIIIQDDSDMKEGTYKIVKGGRSAGHNGINDIYKYILSWGIEIEEITRVKIGIRPEFNTKRAIDFVLSPLTKIDLDNIDKINLSTLNINNQRLDNY